MPETLGASETGANIILISGILAVVLAVIHVIAGKLRFLQGNPRSRWLSLGSGVSVAYVFIHILPELNEQQASIRQAIASDLLVLENHVYLIALVGVAVFYGLERLTKQSRQRRREAGEEDVTEPYVFWIHITSFAIYNALIGYLMLHRESPGVISLLFFALAMGLHFLVNDYGLRQDHKKTYDRIGRWILSAAIILGWVIGTGIEIHRAAIAVLFAFLAGGVVLNVLKEELPEERKSRFWAFALGAAGYTVLLLAI